MARARRIMVAAPARPRPIRPPIEVPTQASVAGHTRAISVAMSDTYCGTAYSAGLDSQSDLPRPATSGHTTRHWPASRRARWSKSRPVRVSPCTQTSTRSLSGSPHSQ
ncbi:Uncharacterised protein [Bordetella pertussis]|nr:Uncharacterised protein [Bordetella pertussis]